MPKIKNNKAAAKRFKRTKTGKFKRNHAYARHLLTHKSSKRKRRLRQTTIVDATDVKRIKRLLPSG